MIERGPVIFSDAARRAEIIYAQARSEIDVRLWRAALGSGSSSSPTGSTPTTPALSLSNLIALVTTQRPEPASAPADSVVAQATAIAPKPDAPVTGLGANERYSATIAQAASRTGIPAAALASIIDAEAAKDKIGQWQAGSRNARSTATGIGQFLSGTWKTEAARAGTWLNETARRNGWIGADGQVSGHAEAALLDLRNNTEAAINATADYARDSLRNIAAAGVSIGNTVDQIAKAAYLGHNLGAGDAIRFLRGGLNDQHARRLLDAQIGSAAAARRIADAGSAAAAHRTWLTEFVDRRINPGQFSL
jgi:hypothetical protein